MLYLILLYQLGFHKTIFYTSMSIFQYCNRSHNNLKDLRCSNTKFKTKFKAHG